jgi:hypothetical protein
VSQEPAAKPAAPESQPAATKGRRMGLANPVVMAKDREVYGAELTLKDDTKLPEILKDPKAFVGKKIRVSAVIQGVCQKKGCWMVVKDGDAQTQVKFHDYSFFVPLDVEGRTCVVEGTAKETVVTEAWRRHYAEDAGKSKEEIEKIKGDEKTVMLIVEAVEIGPPAKKADAKAAESKPAEKKN